MPFAAPAPRRALRALLLGAAALLPLAACEEQPTQLAPPEAPDALLVPRNTYYGPARELGDGRVRSYVVYRRGDPVELGVAFTERALLNLPQHGSGGGAHGDFVEVILPLPPEAPAPYRFVELDWNPHGHEPPGLYDTPHFDFHFYTIFRTQRNAIDPAVDPQYAQKAANLLAPEFTPTGYLAASTISGAPPELAAVPRMGMHWLDPASPELNGQPFTATFIYGSWDGKLIFAEPMVTKAFIESKPDFTLPVPMAQDYQKRGLYPSAYRVYWNAPQREYRVALSGLQYRE